MFQRNNKRDSLPITSYGGDSGGGSLTFGGSSKKQLDGSGRSIKMDAPIVKAWKKAGGYTKVSYYFLAATLFMVFYGFRSLRYWNASIWLTCHQEECTLEVTPPGTKTMTVVFPRSQLRIAQAIKTDADGNFLEIDTDKYEPPPRGGKNKNKYKRPSSYNSKKPDAMGKYKTYRIKFLVRDPTNDEVRDNSNNNIDGNFSKIKDYLSVEEDGGYTMHFRHFGLSQTRMRVRSNVNKVESYIKKRRQKLLLKESATLPWQGILCLVFGLVGILLTLLIGQFYEEETRRQGGPGTRRSYNKNSYRSTSNRRTSSRPKVRRAPSRTTGSQ